MSGTHEYSIYTVAVNAAQARCIVASMYGFYKFGRPVISVQEMTDPERGNYFDVLVWEDEESAENDDGRHAVARYRVAKGEA